MNQMLEKEIVDFIINENERHLQKSKPRNFKITYDMAYFDKLPNTPDMQMIRSSCEKAIKIASNFFSNLITIVPKPAGSMQWDLKLNKCGEASIPAADKTTDKDSDLHLYITFTEEPQDTYLAYAGWCRFIKALGPTHEKSFYGKDAGCSFITGACDDKKREFCPVGSQVQKCDYYYHGIGKCSPSKYLDDKCETLRTFMNARCFDDSNNFQNNPQFKNDMGVSVGSNSKCFNSSLISEKNQPIKEQGMCYSYTCTFFNKLVVNVGGTKVTCSKNGEQLKVPGYSGLLTCPEKLDQFCAFNKYCPNNCNSNGYCNNGTCICMNGFKGAACQQVA
ncbi:hypothetical protein ABPG73_015393 [Tetrahymena malaccensis]